MSDPSAARSQPKRKEGAISLTRRLLTEARSNGAVSIIYYYAHRFSDFGSTLPYLHFETGKVTARQEVPAHHAEVMARCHDYIIDMGKPIILSEVLPIFARAEPELTDEIMTKANKLGVYDQYMIPVFGPYDIDGVIAFGFEKKFSRENRDTMRALEAAAAAYHNRIVRHFGKHEADVELSARENEVLTWIARGKTKSEISTILSISAASVDTYARRIYEKMGVNDRVTAAVAGVTRGLVKPT
ncbi:hypothetical protein INR77_04675 [Erythrobacter sp. SCSIO 43205]|uniref:helix-turn-helix domain-containing protein n=1 Tax=Erythrobacter sp. SCSIO 43205 TaxID=2779361 RepID=UPI001CAA358C|nr:helix-turn-helix transcriptional regulator [Erythrobacter sp. SCSIO 43205]UAB78995.1 hypothetical protein INR77_04675 [Erythrobacter sp. SCSIO 43205]